MCKTARTRDKRHNEILLSARWAIRGLEAGAAWWAEDGWHGGRETCPKTCPSRAVDGRPFRRRRPNHSRRSARPLALATALATAVVAASPPPTSSPPLRSAARLRVLAAQRGNGLSGVEKPTRRPTPYQAKSDERLTERGPRPRPCRARRSCCWPQAGWPCCSRRGTRFVRNVRRRAGLRHCDRPAASRPELSRGRETVLLLGSHLRRGAPCRRPWRWQPLRRRRCTSG